MIKIERKNKPQILEFGADPKSEAEVETLDSIQFFQDDNNSALKFKKTGKNGRRIEKSYTVYSNLEVRKQLKELFYGKCAYCESKISSIYSGDIEHFRPKGRIQNGAGYIKPGYYWLASEWNNLLFACPFCNQTFTHEIRDDGETMEVVLGKHDKFPLDSEIFRLNRQHGQIYLTNAHDYSAAFNSEEQVRLLLKPCTDDVERYFKYEDDGRILPADNLNAFERKQAETSITVYALGRLSLIQAREEKVIEIKAQIRRVEEAIINYNRHSGESHEYIAWYEGILKREMKILADFKQPNMEYAGMARYIIDKYFKLL